MPVSWSKTAAWRWLNVPRWLSWPPAWLRHGAKSHIPIIVLSVKGEERIKIEALDAGADDYVTKPFSMNELLARVRAALRR